MINRWYVVKVVRGNRCAKSWLKSFVSWIWLDQFLWVSLQLIGNCFGLDTSESFSRFVWFIAFDYH